MRRGGEDHNQIESPGDGPVPEQEPFNIGSGAFFMPVETDRRTPYRVGPTGQVEALLVDGEDEIPCELLDISARGVGIELRAGDCPPLGNGDRVRLRFRADGEAAVSAEGRVQSVAEAEGLKRLGVELSTPNGVGSELASAWWSLFNRRAAYRIIPVVNVAEPCRLTLRWGDYARHDVVHDISTTGISLRVPKGQTLELAVDRPVRGWLDLPNTETTLHLVLRLVHSSPTPTAVRMGFVIDTQLTRAYDAQRARISDFVLEGRGDQRRAS